MSDIRKAAEMALEALNGIGCAVEFGTEGLAKYYEPKIPEAILALRKALAHTEQNPVGWMYVNRDGECEQMEHGPIPFWDPDITLLYTAPPKREWVGLTEEEFSDLLYFDGRFDHVEVPLIADFIRAIQDKLKEKNT